MGASGENAVTYAPLRALAGDCPPTCYSPYWRLWQSYDDVYVLRLRVSGVPAISSSSAALLWGKAAGQLQRQEDLNVSGVCLEDLGGGNWIIEVVLTSATGGTVSYHLGWKYNDDTLGERLAAHPAIKAEWPDVAVAPAQWLELEGPGSDLSYWRAAPVLWAHYLTSPDGYGGPSTAYGRGEGAWKGSAASRQVQLQPQPLLPVGHKNGDGAAPLAPTTTIAVAAAAAMVLWLAFGSSSRKATA